MKLDLDCVPATMDEATNMFIDALTVGETEALSQPMTQEVWSAISDVLKSAWSLEDRETCLVKDFCARTGLFGHYFDVTWTVLMLAQNKLYGSIPPNEVIESCTHHQKLFWYSRQIDPKTGRPLLAK